MNRHMLLTALVVWAIGLSGAAGTIEAASHDVAWTFGNVGSRSYRLDAFEPDDAGLGANMGTQNPTLTLQLGKRYQVTVTNYLQHPFEVIAKGSTASNDTVLLSMYPTVIGPWESDADVGWEDNKAGVVTFTLTLDLHNAMTGPSQGPGYRCRPHASSMRGDFNVEVQVVPVPLDDPIPEPIEKGTISIELETIASGLTAPVYLTHAGDGTDRLFVVDQPGKIWIIENGQLLSTPFLDVTGRVYMPGFFGSQDVNDFDERGLLGLAFHPGFTHPASGGYQKIYTYTSEAVDGPADFTTGPLPGRASFDHQSVITEWTVDASNPNIIDTTTRREIMRIDEPQFNHNGGMLEFGPDGYLYISVGDGGEGNDVGDGHGELGNGQNKNTVHGSILRIDPLDPAAMPGMSNPISANGKYCVPADNPFVGVDGIDEIYAYGLRNPWRFSFDSERGLIVADVGQNKIEEIDIIQAGGNYGWNLKEGTFRFDPDAGTVGEDLSGLPPDLIDPVAQYDHDEGISVTGGFVYHGRAIPELWGKYVFGDFSMSFSTGSGRLFYADLDTGLIEELMIGAGDRDPGLFVKAFGQDSSGELYLLAGTNLGPFGSSGLVLKIVDLCTTRLPGDINNDCKVDMRDLAIMTSYWLQSALR